MEQEKRGMEKGVRIGDEGGNGGELLVVRFGTSGPCIISVCN